MARGTWHGHSRFCRRRSLGRVCESTGLVTRVVEDHVRGANLQIGADPYPRRITPNGSSPTGKNGGTLGIARVFDLHLRWPLRLDCN
jgi:hypothetical protein